jgi:hypothetical protein
VNRSNTSIQRAKSLLVSRLGDLDWVTAVGITRARSQFALRLSVRPGCRRRAERVLAELRLDVPVEVLEVAPARAR